MENVKYESMLIYEAADCLGMTLKLDKVAGVRGTAPCPVFRQGTLKFDINQRVVSSAAFKDCHVFLVRFVGNLAGMVIAHKGDNKKRATLHLFNLVKTPQPDDLLERMKPKSAKEAVALIQSGIVKTHTKDRTHVWHDAA